LKSSRISRIIGILTALQTGRHYTVNDLSNIFAASRRTIFRDLQELKAIGVPYNYDAKSGSYMIELSSFFPPANLNIQEAMGLLLLIRKGSEQIHFPFKQSAQLAALKIENILPVKIREYCNASLRNISIRVYHRENLSLLDKIFAQLITAILRKSIVNIWYYLPHEQKTVAVDLSPYHLTYNDTGWYVLGKSSLGKGFHTLKLSRIKEANISNKCFIEDEKFNLSEQLRRAWSITPEGRIYDVKLRFLPKVAHRITEVKWHSTQQITFKNDGSAIVEFCVDRLSEITWWILRYGDQVQVLAPGVLRQRIVKIAQNVIRKNEQLLST
jgi:predicted DNA-binding transcriptional regulator YafY